MAENVEYVLSLKDLFSSKINDANRSAQGLETTMKGIAGLAAIGFGLIGGIDFLKDSVRAFNEADKAGAQLNATLASTGGIAGRTKEQLDKQAESLMKMSTFDDDAITGAQSLLLTFTNIRGEILDKTTPAILDLATKMGGDLQGATMLVARAMNDPISGLTMLSRKGITFTDTQKEMMKQMTLTGNIAGAQSMILEELNKKFGGSAQADANTYSGQMTILQHEFMNVKEEIGGVIMKLVVGLKPALERGIELFSNTVHWLKENKEIIEGVVISVSALGLAWGAFNIVGVLSSITVYGLMESIIGLTAAMYANPVGIIVGAFVLLGTVIYTAWQKSETFRGGVLGIWEVMKGFFSFIMNTGSGVANIMQGILSGDPSQVIGGVQQVKDAWKNLDVAGDFNRGMLSGASAVAGQGGLNTDFGNGGNKITGKFASTSSNTPTSKAGAGKSASSVTGQKVYTINIKIDNLVKDFKVSTTNITEGAGKVKELVAQALLSAVNDSQIIADR